MLVGRVAGHHRSPAVYMLCRSTVALQVKSRLHCQVLLVTVWKREVDMWHGEFKNQWSGVQTYRSWIFNNSDGIWRNRHVIHNTGIFTDKKGTLIRYSEGKYTQKWWETTVQFLEMHPSRVVIGCACQVSCIVKWCVDPFEYGMIETQIANSFQVYPDNKVGIIVV